MGKPVLSIGHTTEVSDQNYAELVHVGQLTRHFTPVQIKAVCP